MVSTPTERQEAIGRDLIRSYEATQGRTLRSIEQGWDPTAPGLQDWTAAHLDGMPAGRLSADYVAYQADGSIDRVIEVKTKRHSNASGIPMKERQLNAAGVLGGDYWLYVVFDCAGPEPYLVVVRDPARLGWHLVSDEPAVTWAKKGSIGAERTFFIAASEALAAGERVPSPHSDAYGSYRRYAALASRGPWPGRLSSTYPLAQDRPRPFFPRSRRRCPAIAPG